MSESKFAQIGLTEFKQELKNKSTILIDVRTPEELNTYGTISDDQLHIIFGGPDFAAQIHKLDTSKKYLLYCWHGNRSSAARGYMMQKGFTWVKDLEGGIDNWNRG